MILQEKYYFNEYDYDIEGIHKSTGEDFFFDFIRRCEKKFYKKYEPFFANVLAANSNTMFHLKKSLQGAANEIFRLETINGEINLEMNFKIQKFSKNKLVYALTCYRRENEPLYLLIDNNCSTNEFVLKYVSNNDNDDGVIGEYIPDDEFDFQIK